MNQPVENFSIRELHALQRHYIAFFVERCVLYLSPNTPYLDNWHHHLLGYHLERVARGQCKRLIINVPPRSMKSSFGSIGFPAWLLGQDPTKQVICVSYSQDLADKLADDCRSVMQSPWYQQLFPRTRLARSRSALSFLKTTHGGGRRATSVGGTLTGLGADVIVIDDPLKPVDATTAERQRANDWVANTVLSRLNDKRNGAIVIIMQRLHLDDVVGHVLAKGEWEVITLPAVALEDEVHEYQTIFGPYRVERSKGEALHTDREPIEVLDRLKREMGPYEFAGQYLQQPIPEGGGVVKAEWLQFYDPEDLPLKPDMVIHSWDTASKATEKSDYSVCTIWWVKDRKRYLREVIRERMEFPTLKAKVIELYKRDRPTAIVIEDQASGIQLIQELREHKIYDIYPVRPQGDKVMRLRSHTPAMVEGTILFPRKAPWLEAYLWELTVFPNGKHDDQVDSTSQALHWMANPPKGWGFLEYMRQDIERMKAEGRL